jgi:uncharacterized protein YecE (DUF72 family)
MTKAAATAAGRIRVGVGGWSFPPWRETFYPPGVAKAGELAYAAGVLTAIEINATYYRGQSAATFAKWREATPDGFMFTVKASRFATQRSDLREAGEAVRRQCEGGIAELGPRLGPILWQLAPTKRFDRDEIAAFLDLLPARAGGLALRHAVEARHESFVDPAFVALMRARGAAIVLAGDSKYPLIADQTADFVYARIMGTREGEPLGYAPGDLDLWARRARAMARGETPEGLASAAGAPGAGRPRDVFLFVISGFKPANPAAAQALIARLDGPQTITPERASSQRKAAPARSRTPSSRARAR